MTEPKTRREILKLATAGGAGLLVASGAGAGVASAGRCEANCGVGQTFVKYELVELEGGRCEFREETNTGIFGDSLTITECKDGETTAECEGSCEPLTVTWDDSRYDVETLTVKAGNNCEQFEGPNGEYTSTLRTNRGTVAAISNLQFCVEPVEPLECPDGTTQVARYDVDGTDVTFVDGEDVVEFSNETVDGSGSLTGFDFESIDGADPNTEPETLTTVTVEYGSTTETFEVDPDFDVDKQSGTVSVDAPIDRVLFCRAVYAQADFVTGDVITDLCESQYSDDKISSVTWSSYNGQLDGVQGQFDGGWTFNVDGTVSVDYDPAEYDQTVSLAVYEVDDPTFQPNDNISFSETRCRQTLVDSDSDASDNQDGTLTAALPTPSP